MFTPKIGEDEPILTHIFQVGWFNHQLVVVSKVFYFQPYILGEENPRILTDVQMSHNGLVETNHQLENRCFNSNVGIFEALEGNQLTAFPAMQLSP